MNIDMAKMSAKGTAIGRVIDITYFPNLLMVMTVGFMGFVAGSVDYTQHQELSQALELAIAVILAAGASWIIARELDPAHDYSAFIGMLPAALLTTGTLDLWVIGSILLLVRMVSRIVGPPSYLTDSIGIAVLIGLAIFLSQSWLIGVLGVIGFTLDAWLRPGLPRQYIFAGILGILTVVALSLTGIEAIQLPDASYLSAMLFLTIGYLIFLWQTPIIDIHCDYGERYAVQQHRLKISMILGVAGAFIISLWGGNTIVQELLPIWTALAGIIVYWLVQKAYRILT